jgi:hypothetical protein
MALPAFATKEAQQAQELIHRFNKLTTRAYENLSPEQLIQLNQDAFEALGSAHQYFLAVLDLQLLHNFPLWVKPSIVNDALTFTEHYMQLISYFNRNAKPLLDVRFMDVFWLPTITTTAKIISDNVGSYNSDLRARAEEFATRFADFLIFSIELQGEYRLETTDIPVANEHRLSVLNLLRAFRQFLRKILILVQQNRIPGTLTPLYINRSIRIVCYYEIQLSAISDSEKPDCNHLSTTVK